MTTVLYRYRSYNIIFVVLFFKQNLNQLFLFFFWYYWLTIIDDFDILTWLNNRKTKHQILSSCYHSYSQKDIINGCPSKVIFFVLYLLIKDFLFIMFCCVFSSSWNKIRFLSVYNFFFVYQILQLIWKSRSVMWSYTYMIPSFYEVIFFLANLPYSITDLTDNDVYLYTLFINICSCFTIPFDVYFGESPLRNVYIDVINFFYLLM